MRTKTQKGFTLVEIGIVLVIIGLLIGGTLKGQEMITNAKIKRVIRDKAGINSAVHTYQDRYQRLPGDDDRADQRFSIYSDGTNDPAPADINGDRNGSIAGNWVAAPNTETANFWKHLRAAGIIPGGGDDDTQPGNAYGGLIGLRDGSLLISGHVIIFGSMEGPIAKILEHQFDDSSPATGRIQSDLTAALMDGGAISSAGAVYLDSSRYFMALHF